MQLQSVPTSEPLPLAAVGTASVAYGLRKLRAEYAGALVRVRESGGDTLLDIDPDAEGNLDTDALLAHVGVNDGYVETWYDQSGNAANLTNATNAQQPKIVDAGSVCMNFGNPTLQFRSSNLTGIASSAIDSGAFTLLCDVQERNAWWDQVGPFFYLGTSPVAFESWFDVQRIVAVTYSSGGSPSQTLDASDYPFTTVRKQIVAMVSDSGDFSVIVNDVAVDTWTMANFGRTSTQVRLGTTNAFSNFDISELIIYGSALSDSSRQEVARAMNAYHGVMPQRPMPAIGLRARIPDEDVIRKWIDDIPATDLNITRGNLSWDETYPSVDYLYNTLYHWLVGGQSNMADRRVGMLCHTDFYRIEPDTANGGDGGLEGGLPGSKTLRTFRGSNQGTGAMLYATFFANSLPKAASAEGNPYYQQRAVALRAVIHAITATIRYMQYAGQNLSGYERTDYIGGNLMTAAYVYELCKGVLPVHVQNAYENILFYIVERCWWLEARNTAGNMDMKCVAGLARCYNIFSQQSRKDKCLEATKRLLFGAVDGTPETTVFGVGLWLPHGGISEGDSAETTYSGHSANLALEAYTLTKDDPAWAFMETIVEGMLTFKIYQYFIDPDGYQDGPSGYAGRTGGSYVYDQGTESWRDTNAAAHFTVGRPLVTDLPTAVELVTAINSAVTAWNTTHNIDDDCVLVQGTAAAHTGGASTTTITLTGSPDLSGVVFTTANDWRPWIWLNVNGGIWSLLSSADNTAKTVTGSVTVDIESGSAVDYRIEKGPLKYSATAADGSMWPPENLYKTPAGFHAAQSALIAGSDASLDTPWQSTANHNVSFNDGDFWSYKNASGGREFGWFVESMTNPGRYDGWIGGTIQEFWTRDTGTVIRARHDKSGGGGVAQNENTRVWDWIDEWATSHVWCVDNNGKRFSSVVSNNLTHTVTDNTGLATPQLVNAATFDFGVTSGFESGSGITGTITVTNTFTANSDGLTHLVEVDHTGTDTISELWATIPVFLRDGDQSMADTVIQYWDGATWRTLTSTIVSVDDIRLGRDFGSGREYVWIRFAATQDVCRNGAIWVESYQGNGRYSIIKADLLGYTGSGQSFPASASVQYSVTVTDPGHTPTQPSVDISFPRAATRFPVGGAFVVQASVEWVATAGTLAAEYTTNGTDWTSLGAMTNTTGDVWEFAGGTVPSGLQQVRVTATPPSGSPGTTATACTSTTPTLKLEDNFTAADDTAINTSYSAWTTNTTGNNYQTWNSAKVTGNKATAVTAGSQGAAFGVDTNEREYVVVECEMTAGTGSATDEGMGVLANTRFSSMSFAISAGVLNASFPSATFRLRIRGNTVTTKTFAYSSYNKANPYRVVLQITEDVAIARFYDGVTLAGTIYHIGIEQDVWDSHGMTVGDGTCRGDALKVYSY